MAGTGTHEERLQQLFEVQRFVRSRDLESLGVPRVYLTRLLQQGAITRVDRGLYECADAPLGQWDTLAEVCERIPKATICLLSALQFHDLTTQSPHKVWIALPPGTHKPRTDIAKLEIIYMNAAALPATSIQVAEEAGAEIRITTRAKTVADAFKYRNRMGMDVALEALKDYVHGRGDLNELLEEAERDRVTALIRPVLEGLLV